MKLKATGISKEYRREAHGTNRLIAVAETDFSLEGGQLAVLLGRSGSGKTTLLNMLAGLLAPTTGRIEVFDEDTSQAEDLTDMYAAAEKHLARWRNENLGVVPQGQTALHTLTVLENVMLPAGIYKDTPHEEIRNTEARAYALLRQLEIEHLAGILPRELSGGELRRVAIARALLRRPGIVLADEPTGDLDDESTTLVLKTLRLAADEGAAVLIVTHEDDAQKYADVVYRMTAGVLERLCE